MQAARDLLHWETPGAGSGAAGKSASGCSRAGGCATGGGAGGRSGMAQPDSRPATGFGPVVSTLAAGKEPGADEVCQTTVSDNSFAKSVPRQRPEYVEPCCGFERTDRVMAAGKQ